MALKLLPLSHQKILSFIEKNPVGNNKAMTTNLQNIDGKALNENIIIIANSLKALISVNCKVNILYSGTEYEMRDENYIPIQTVNSKKLVVPLTDAEAVLAEKAKYKASVTILNSVQQGISIKDLVIALKPGMVQEFSISKNFNEKSDLGSYLSTVNNVSISLAKQAALGAVDNTATITIVFTKGAATQSLDVVVTIQNLLTNLSPDQVAVNNEAAKYNNSTTILNTVDPLSQIQAQSLALNEGQTKDASIVKKTTMKNDAGNYFDWKDVFYDFFKLLKKAPFGATDNLAVITLTFTKAAAVATKDIFITIENQPEVSDIAYEKTFHVESTIYNIPCATTFPEVTLTNELCFGPNLDGIGRKVKIFYLGIFGNQRAQLEVPVDGFDTFPAQNPEEKYQYNAGTNFIDFLGGSPGVKVYKLVIYK